MGSGEGERHRGAASELIPAVQTRGGHCAHGAATRTQARGISQPGRFPYASPLQIIPARRSRDYTRSAVLPAYPRPHSLRTLGTCQSNTLRGIAGVPSDGGWSGCALPAAPTRGCGWGGKHRSAALHRHQGRRSARGGRGAVSPPGCRAPGRSDPYSREERSSQPGRRRVAASGAKRRCGDTAEGRGSS